MSNSEISNDQDILSSANYADSKCEIKTEEMFFSLATNKCN